MTHDIVTEKDREENCLYHFQTQTSELVIQAKAANVIRRSLDHDSLLRRFLIVDPLPQGCSPVYDVEKQYANIGVTYSKNTDAYFISPTREKEKEYEFRIPINSYEFSVSGKPNEARSEEANIATLLYRTGREIRNLEREVLVKMLMKSSDLPSDFVTIRTEGTNMWNKVTHTIDVMMKQIYLTDKKLWPERAEQDRIRLGKIILSLENLGKFFDSKQQDMKDVDVNYWEPNSCTYKGVEIYSTKFMPDDVVIGVPDPEYLGVVSIETDVVTTYVSDTKVESFMDVGYEILAPNLVVRAYIIEP